MRTFFDTSAFAKRYVEEPGSDRVQELCDAADDLVVSALCLPELVSTLCRLVRERRLLPAEYRRIRAELLRDLGDAEIAEITPAVVARAVACLESGPLRALDAVQLGCALVAAPDLFASADRGQLAAARRAGLRVVAV